MKTELLIHEDTLQTLDALLMQPPHAVLFTGAAGTGKAILSRQFCAELLRIRPTQLAAHPYTRIVDPDEGTIAIATVRELAHFVSLRVPGDISGTARVILVPDADRMTREAQNALLKLLEEPPEHTTIVLTSSQPRKLLQTIRSRVQVVPIHICSEAAIATHFTTLGYDAKDVEKAQLLAGGSMARMAQILSGEDSASAQLVDHAKAILTGDMFTRLCLIDTSLKDKATAQSVVDTLVLIASSSLQRSDSGRLAKWQQVLTAAVIAQQALSRNGNQKLVLTELMLSL